MEKAQQKYKISISKYIIAILFILYCTTSCKDHSINNNIEKSISISMGKNSNICWIQEGDIFSFNKVLNYAHGCNCAGAMGKGIALQFKKNWPEMYAYYKNLCKKDQFNLGDIYVYHYGNGYIFNLGTQKSWRAKANIQAIEEALLKMLSFASKHSVKDIALPKIGAGLGGLKWEDVKEVIEKVAAKYPKVNLWVIESYKKETSTSFY